MTSLALQCLGAARYDEAGRVLFDASMGDLSDALIASGRWLKQHPRYRPLGVNINYSQNGQHLVMFVQEAEE